MSVSDRNRWNEKYAAKTPPAISSPDDWLVRNVANRPTGRAIELACGLGQNAIWLAQQGWTVDAIDISAVGLALARQSAEITGPSQINWMEADLDVFEPRQSAYDLILVFRFLDRGRLPAMIESALRPGGLLIYETFMRGQLSRPDNHLKNADFTLAPGELVTLFPNLIVVAAEEVDLPDRCVSRLAARKQQDVT